MLLWLWLAIGILLAPQLQYMPPPPATVTTTNKQTKPKGREASQPCIKLELASYMELKGGG